jgi:type IV pilus assembly protein PilQ
MKKLICFMLLLLCLLPVMAEVTSEMQVDEDTITLSEDMSLNHAIQALELLSTRYSNQKIMNMSNTDQPIGVPIHSLRWLEALKLIALQNHFILEEQSGVVLVMLPKDEKKVDDVTLDTKQVQISAIALIADRTYVEAMGVDWGSVIGGKVNANIDFFGKSVVPSEMVKITWDHDFKVGGLMIPLSTVINVLESNQKGTVIAKPNIIVASGKKGYIQVGQDFSVKTKDEAGNVADKFFATGVIMDVSPEIISDGKQEAIHLTVRVERSSAVPGNITTIINKSQSSTDIVLYDGEETVIGGLYTTEETKERSGIPILKNLPWWVFGIRYLAGNTKLNKNDRELIIIMKVNIIDSVRNRITKGSGPVDPLKEKVMKAIEDQKPIPNP